jgi:hypothetical protein
MRDVPGAHADGQGKFGGKFGRESTAGQAQNNANKGHRKAGFSRPVLCLRTSRSAGLGPDTQADNSQTDVYRAFLLN